MPIVDFNNAKILEIGCGDGGRSRQIAEKCGHLTAIEPDQSLLARAKSANNLPNIDYLPGSASRLEFADQTFDIIFYTLSFHHVPANEIIRAIDEAVRVVKPDGFVVFLEPTFDGSFFESEIIFDGCDGDERKEKASAYAAMLGCRKLNEIAEVRDETIFFFDSVDDFIASMRPKKGLRKDMEAFLRLHDFTLDAQRRINVFKPVTSPDAPASES